MSKLTHSQKRNKQRRSLPAAKRKRALTSKLRLLRIEAGTRRKRTKEHRPASSIVHKGRVPGTTRKSRMPGGSGFRNNWQFEGELQNA